MKNKLNKTQKAAVESFGNPILIFAGAGSGKTRVLTHKISYLIEKKLVKGENILALTFTNKAAKEMKSRVEKLINKNGALVTMGTFHSICAKILRNEIHHLGYSKDFSIFDVQDQISLLKVILDEMGILKNSISPQEARNQISLYKNKLITPSIAKRQGTLVIEKTYAEIYNNYQKWNNKLVDFAKAKGLLDAEQARIWKEHSSYYPFYRNMVEEGLGGPNIASGSLPNNPLSIKIEGSEEGFDISPVEAIARNSLSILTASMKNDGLSKLIRDFQSLDMAEELQVGEKVGLNTIFVFKNGEKIYYNLTEGNKELLEGIRSVGGVGMDGFLKMIAMPSSLLRDTVTRDPGFVVVNILRDTLSSAVTSGAPLGGEGFVPVIDSFKNMFGLSLIHI